MLHRSLLAYRRLSSLLLPLGLALACGSNSDPANDWGAAGVGNTGQVGTTGQTITSSSGPTVGSVTGTATSGVASVSNGTDSSSTFGAVSGGSVTGATTGGLTSTSTLGDASTTTTTGFATVDGGVTGSGGTSSTGDVTGTATSSTTSATGVGGAAASSTVTSTVTSSTVTSTATSTTGGQAGPTTVWIAGDSTVANGNTPCPAGWGKHFAPYFNNQVTINNAAVGGRSVRTWLYNVTTEMDSTGECVLQTDGSGQPTLQARWQTMLDGMKAGDTLIIQFGINDGSATCDRHVGLQAFKDSYGMMAEAAKARGTQPIFVTPVSAIACSGSTAVGTRGGYVGATFEAGTEYGVPVIDLHQLSVDLYNSLGFCPVPGGDVSAATTGPVGDFFCDDHTHFSDIGAPQIAGLVANGLKTSGVGLSQYLLE